MRRRFRRSPTPARTAVIVAADFGVAGMLRDQIREAGYRPIWASDVGEAIAAITHERPELLVVDVGPGSVGGWELLTKLDRSPALARIPRVLLGVLPAGYTRDGGANEQSVSLLL